MKIDISNSISFNINHFMLAHHLHSILYRRQLTCVNTFVIHCQATCFQVIPDAQVSLASLEHVLYWPCRQALLGHVCNFNASIIAFLIAVLPLLFNDEVEAI